MKLLENEIEVMKHCIGLGTRKPYTRHGKMFYRPYRNRYYTYIYSEIWRGLESKGYAKHEDVRENQETIFYLTRKGLDALGEAIGVHIYDEED